MRGLICFMSLMLIIFGIEKFSIITDLILLGTFAITSKKYWIK